ncbi:DUF2177 family protein [Frigidibacter sp. ROC022]|uniref:DUF2177 family protein n=1 Tax=Frigidibacter sp. ROC022 TaxID=2971796 RepID=UPI00215B1202|nr:DUF2177 family protein [Frigidibacter sp. ROC022]MCR8726147.1 DUF2177 family protein [Frigidibacter sp. ROC022]
MQILILYGVTAVFFFALDAAGLRLLIKPVFERHVSHLFAEPFRVVPAALFYLGYVAGLLWFVSLPALRAGDPLAALLGGVALGLLAYGTYEFTNYATLRDWSVEQLVVDTIWGGVLTGVSAWAGVLLVRALG